MRPTSHGFGTIGGILERAEMKQTIGTIGGGLALLALAACSSGTASPHSTPTLDTQEKAALTKVETKAQTCQSKFQVTHPVRSLTDGFVPCMEELVKPSQRSAFGSFLVNTGLRDKVWHKKNRSTYYDAVAQWLVTHANS